MTDDEVSELAELPTLPPIGQVVIGKDAEGRLGWYRRDDDGAWTELLAEEEGWEYGTPSAWSPEPVWIEVKRE